MINKPIVSVIMSFYKEDLDFIKIAIRSILEQTLTNLEFIIINDNPLDTLIDDYINSILKLDNRIIYKRNPQNIGLTKSLNVGINISNGYYIARMDADDISHPDRLMQQLSFLKNHPEVIAVGSWAHIINEEGIRIKSVKKSTTSTELKAKLIFESPLIHPVIMFKKETGGKVWKYNPSFKYSQDYELFSRMCHKGEIANLPKYLIYYRISQNQISKKYDIEQKKYAVMVQEFLLSSFNIELTPKEEDIFYSLTRNIGNTKSNSEEIELFLLKLNKNLSKTKYYIKNTVQGYIIHIYAIHLTHKYFLSNALFKLFIFQIKIKQYNLYALFSLIANNKLWQYNKIHKYQI